MSRQIARLVSPAAAALVLSLAVAATPAEAQTGAPETPRTGIGRLPAIDFRTPERAPSLGRLVTDLGADFRRLPSDTNLMAVVLGGSFGALFNHSDDEITGAMHASPVEAVLDPGKHVGGAAFQLGGAALTYAVGHLASKPVVATLGADLVRAGLVAQAITQAIKLTAGRTRPDGSSYSFPSGHASGTFASATVLHRRFGWKVGLPAYAVATYVAANRLADNRHFLSDVIFGAAIGIVAGRTVTVGIGDTRFALTPAVVRGGVGISLVGIGKK